MPTTVGILILVVFNRTVLVVSHLFGMVMRRCNID